MVQTGARVPRSTQQRKCTRSARTRQQMLRCCCPAPRRRRRRQYLGSHSAAARMQRCHHFRPSLDIVATLDQHKSAPWDASRHDITKHEAQCLEDFSPSWPLDPGVLVAARGEKEGPPAPPIGAVVVLAATALMVRLPPASPPPPPPAKLEAVRAHRGLSPWGDTHNVMSGQAAHGLVLQARGATGAGCMGRAAAPATKRGVSRSPRKTKVPPPPPPLAGCKPLYGSVWPTTM